MSQAYVQPNNPVPPLYEREEYDDTDFVELREMDVKFTDSVYSNDLVRDALEERLRDQYGDDEIAISPETGALTATFSSNQVDHFMRTYTEVVQPGSYMRLQDKEYPVSDIFFKGDDGAIGVTTRSSERDGLTDHTTILDPITAHEINVSTQCGNIVEASTDAFVSPAYSALEFASQSKDNAHLVEGVSAEETKPQSSVYDRINAIRNMQQPQQPDNGLER